MNDLAQSWQGHSLYTFPPFSLIGRILQKMRQEQVKELVLIDCFSLVWYPQLLSQLVDFPHLLPLSHSLLLNPLGQPHPLVLEGTLLLAAWSVRHSEQFRSLSDETFQLISAAWKRDTEKSYNSAWSNCCGWCAERGINPILPSIEKVLEFLTARFKSGLQYSTLNFYCSSLSATIPPIKGSPVGQHSLVVRLMQGIFNSRPTTKVL